MALLEEDLVDDDLLDDETEEDRALTEDVVLDSTSTEFVKQIVDRTMIFLEFLCDTKLFPYQQQIARRIIESLIINDGEEITVIQSRQSGKSEVLANVVATVMVLFPKLAPMFPDLLGKFDRGVMVGTFAPVESQAETLYGRIVDRLTSERAIEVMLDPEIDDKPTGGGKIIKLARSGSFCRMQTANPRAKIESKSYHFIVIDEAQHCDDYTVRKSIHPMGAFYNATIVKTGTPDVTKGDFYSAIQHNKRRQTKGRRQNHFEFDYRACAKYNPNYAKFIAKEKLRIGEDSDEFQLSYACVAPSTKVLTADLRYVAIGDLQPGDRLVGFDEERPGKGQHRKFRESEVLRTTRIVKPGYRVTLEDGTTLDCSYDHQWLVSTAGRRTVWKATEDLVETDRIFKVADVWGEAEQDYETGYLAASFDGEGNCTNTRSGQIQLVFSQKENAMLDKVRKFLAEKGFTYYEAENKATGVKRIGISGGRAATLRFLGTIRPERLLANIDVEMWGSIGRHDHTAQDFEHPRVVGLEYLGQIEVVPLETSTRTYVAEGLASHNCRWLLERGMFTSDAQMEALGDKSMEVVKAHHRSPVVVGIDPARKMDSTVVTVVWVDWDRPDEFGFYDHRILNWMELQGDDWEEQYFRVIEFLANYDVLRVGVDAQGVGDAVAQRLAVLMPDTEVVPVGSNSSDQSTRWKHLMQLMQRGMVGWPAHAKTRRLRTYRRFHQQMVDLEKKYQGKYMLAAAPEEAEAHDDYPDSLAIACSMTIDATMPEVEISESPFVAGTRRR